MRVDTQHRMLQADPGQSIDITVDVVNTTALIDGVSADLAGLPDATVLSEPALLPLFPDARGQIRLRVTVPTTAAAGTHQLSVAILSTAGSPTQFVDLELSVSARPSLELHREPKVIRSRRKAVFGLEVVNTGNTALDVTLEAARDDRRTAVTFSPQQLSVSPGEAVGCTMLVRGPRMLTGGEVDRPVTIDVRARRIHSIPAMTETETEPELQVSSEVVLRQRPLIGRGLLTVLILASIVALWALAFLLGLTQVFAGDPLTKTAPVSFAPSAVRAQEDGRADPENPAGTAPAGALPKSGLVPADVGGSVSGIVSARSNRAPVGRILVQAFRQGRNGPVLVSSAASQSDGSFTVAGLFPTKYTLKFSAKGFTPVWYPSAPSRTGASVVPVAAQTATKGITTTIRGLPATISGTIEPGDSLDPPVTEVVARMVDAAADGTTIVSATTPAARTVSDASGAYTLSGLPAPGTYELSFSAPGYRVTKVLTAVTGGETRLQPGVTPGAGFGSISGTVTDGKSPLGNVSVATNIGSEQVVVTTPTVGAVGAFSIGNLPTPGTYVVQFTSESHGSITRIVNLEAGASERALKVDLAAGTGSVSGRLVALDGTGLGGATVTVGGTQTDGEADSVPTTTTLSTGVVGAFSISGLPAPGEYTLTFTLPGYGSETVPVSLDAAGPAPTLRVELGSRLGRVQGQVRGPAGKPYVGANVTLTNGKDVWTATTTAPGGALTGGGYVVASLPPGTYSVTVTAAGLRQQTAMVTVYPGITSIQNLQLGST